MDLEEKRAQQRAYSQTPKRRERVKLIAKQWRAKNRRHILFYKRRYRRALKAKAVKS